MARIRTKELSLLTSAFMEQLLSAKTVKECLALLSERGWKAEGEDAVAVEEMLSGERDKTWNTIAELVDDMSAFDVFLYASDYHNVKAAIKDVCTSSGAEGIYLSEGTVPVDVVKKAALESDYSLLPEHMRAAAQEAKDILLHTRDGQLCDVILDKAALEAIAAAGVKSKSPLLEEYGELTAATGNIKTAIRAARAKKDRAFLEKAIASCATIDRGRLIDAAAAGEDEIMHVLETTPYADAIGELKKSPSAFEKWCDDRMMVSIQKELHHPFTIGPLAAYILARESEIRSVRIILTGKTNELPEDSIRERIRKTYV